MSNAAKTVEMVCGKCDGAGKLIGFMHIENGKCFSCMGAGTVSVQPLSVRKAAMVQAACTLESLSEDGDRILDTNAPWAQHMARRAAVDMLIAADTTWARRQLANLPAGIRAAVIAAGREMKVSA
jgi:hypothetical protein